MAQTVKCLPAMWETQVQSLDWEDHLEKAMAPHSSTLAWKIPWTEEPGRLQSMGSLGVRHDRATSLSLYIVVQMVKASGYNAGDLGWILGWEDTLEKEIATHSSTLAWKIAWIEEPGGLQSMGSQRVGHD